MSDHVSLCEIDKIKTMRTWAFAQDIIHEQNGSNAKNLAMFKMAGEIMSDFKGSFGQCTVFDGQKPYSTATELLLKNGVWGTSLSPLTQLAMAGTESGTLRQDVPGFINAAFCI